MISFFPHIVQDIILSLQEAREDDRTLNYPGNGRFLHKLLLTLKLIVIPFKLH